MHQKFLVMLRTKRTQNIDIVKLCLVSILEFNRKKHVLIVETTDRTSYADTFYGCLDTREEGNCISRTPLSLIHQYSTYFRSRMPKTLNILYT